MPASGQEGFSKQGVQAKLEWHAQLGWPALWNVYASYKLQGSFLNLTTGAGKGKTPHRDIKGWPECSAGHSGAARQQNH